MPRSRRHQRGNGLVFALLGILLLGLTAAAQVEGTKVQLRSQAGHTEATLMQNLAAASNNLIFEHFSAVQNGDAVTKLGISIAPALIDGELVWDVQPDALRSMGYLPAGWNAGASSLTGGAYRIRFARAPVGCAVSACNIEGSVINLQPVLADERAGTQDGRAIGPFLATVGADAGVSLVGSSAAITGLSHSWSTPNPVSGTPAGVLGIRIGSGSAGWGQFVRIGDSRDPSLNGNLSVAGNGSYGGTLAVSGATTLGGATTVNNATLSVRNGATACVELLPTGQINIACAGRLNAQTGVFTDGAGNTSQIGPTGLVTTGRVRAADGFEGAGGNAAFTAADPNAITVAAGDLFVRGAAGMLMRVTATGDVVAQRDLVGTNNISGQRVAIRELVVEDTVCAASSGPLAAGTEVAALATGGLALCRAGRWTALQRNASVGTACAKDGAGATDDASGRALICRGGHWVATSMLMSSFVLVSSQAVVNGSVIAKPVCPSVGSEPVVPLIMLLPAGDEIPFESTGGFLEAINRYALDGGGTWTVRLESASGRGLNSSALAHAYCWYPST